MTKLKKIIIRKVGKKLAKQGALLLARKEVKIIASATATYASHRVLQKVAARYPRLNFLAGKAGLPS
jgi:hypothetical protein